MGYKSLTSAVAGLSRSILLLYRRMVMRHCFKISSVSLALASGALLFVGLLDYYDEQRLSAAVTVGVAAGLMVLTRPQLIVYAAPAITWTLARGTVGVGSAGFLFEQAIRIHHRHHAPYKFTIVVDAQIFHPFKHDSTRKQFASMHTPY